ncbi:hypothetical protein [Streptomyces gelaticus]|uniref:hypothetical protein n=1 Tax=Streptomyces gelaticus TaxID=285446 RepID=UPI00167A656D|nr:hypothetical protein [Streptomyces gelaticus]
MPGLSRPADRSASGRPRDRVRIVGPGDEERRGVSGTALVEAVAKVAVGVLGTAR